MPVHVAVLVVVGGLPATGKSTTAEHLARHIRAPYLRVDRIEQAIVATSPLLIRWASPGTPSPTPSPRSDWGWAWPSSSSASTRSP